MREIMGLADRANQYIDHHKPWVLAKDPEREAEVQAVCTQGLNLFRVLVCYLKPVLPGLAAKAETFLDIAPLDWSQAGDALLGRGINRFQPLMTRIEADKVQAMVEAEAAGTAPAAAPTGPLADDPVAAEIGIDDFIKVDLRVARIAEAEAVAEADKLVRLTLDLGGETRNVFAGIKAAYRPQDLVGRHVVMVANLKPRKMRFGLSEGMVLAAGPGGSDIFLLDLDQGAEPGMRVK